MAWVVATWLSSAAANAAEHDPVLKALSENEWRVSKCESFIDGGTTRAILASEDGQTVLIVSRVIDFGDKPSVISVQRMAPGEKPLIVRKSQDLEIVLGVVKKVRERSDPSRRAEFTNAALDAMTRSLKRRVSETR